MRFEPPPRRLETELSRGHPLVAKTRHNLALAATRQGNHAAAVTEFVESATILESVYGPKHPDLAMIYRNTAEALHAQGDLDRALVQAERALALWEVATGERSVSDRDRSRHRGRGPRRSRRAGPSRGAPSQRLVDPGRDLRE